MSAACIWRHSKATLVNADRADADRADGVRSIIDGSGWRLTIRLVSLVEWSRDSAAQATSVGAYIPWGPIVNDQGHRGSW